MGGVAEGTEVGVVGGSEEDAAAGPGQAMKLLHGADHILHVFNHVDSADLSEGAVAKGVRKAVEVGEDVGAAGGIAVETDGAGELVDAAPDVKDGAGRLGMVGRKTQYPPNVRYPLALSSDVPGQTCGACCYQE